MSIFAGDNIRSVPPIAVNQTDAAARTKALADVMTFDAAARAVGMCRDHVREVSFKHNIAIPWGRAKVRRHYRVKLSDLEAAILRERGTAPGSKPLHRLVKC